MAMVIFNALWIDHYVIIPESACGHYNWSMCVVKIIYKHHMKKRILLQIIFIKNLNAIYHFWSFVSTNYSFYYIYNTNYTFWIDGSIQIGKTSLWSPWILKFTAAFFSNTESLPIQYANKTILLINDTFRRRFFGWESTLW